MRSPFLQGWRRAFQKEATKQGVGSSCPTAPIWGPVTIQHGLVFAGHGIGGCGEVRYSPFSESTELGMVTKSPGSVKELWKSEEGPLKDSI